MIKMYVVNIFILAPVPPQLNADLTDVSSRSEQIKTKIEQKKGLALQSKRKALFSTPKPSSFSPSPCKLNKHVSLHYKVSFII